MFLFLHRKSGHPLWSVNWCIGFVSLVSVNVNLFLWILIWFWFPVFRYLRPQTMFNFVISWFWYLQCCRCLYNTFNYSVQVHFVPVVLHSSSPLLPSSTLNSSSSPAVPIQPRSPIKVWISYILLMSRKPSSGLGFLFPKHTKGLSLEQTSRGSLQTSSPIKIQIETLLGF